MLFKSGLDAKHNSTKYSENKRLEDCFLCCVFNYQSTNLRHEPLHLLVTHKCTHTTHFSRQTFLNELFECSHNRHCKKNMMISTIRTEMWVHLKDMIIRTFCGQCVPPLSVLFIFSNLSLCLDWWCVQFVFINKHKWKWTWMLYSVIVKESIILFFVEILLML